MEAVAMHAVFAFLTGTDDRSQAADLMKIAGLSLKCIYSDRARLSHFTFDRILIVVK